MKTLLIDNGSLFLDNLKKLLVTDGNNEVSVISYSEISNQGTDNYDLVVLSGGHHKFSISELPKEINQLAKSKDGSEIIKHISKHHKSTIVSTTSLNRVSGCGNGSG